MKTKLIKLVALALLLSTLNHQLSTALAQGSLTPPGAPAPTMKTLDQIEPRTPISSLPFAITNSGSYYLTTNLTVATGDAITIATNGVTLDLSGFTISSIAPSATGTGIQINGGLRNLTILNGHLQGGVTNNGSGVYSGPGFAHGINYTSLQPANTRVSGVSVSGCLLNGIFLENGNATVVENCMVRSVGGFGIVAFVVKDSVAVTCGLTAIGADQASNCRGQCDGSFYGVRATTAQNCYGSSGSSSGIDTTTALNCYGYSSGGSGINATTAQNCYGASLGSGVGVSAINAENCRGSSSSGYGLYTATAQNCYGSSDSSTGLHAYRTAIGCSGVSSTGNGLYGFTVNNCHGQTSGTTGTAYGIYAYDIATGSYGASGAGGVGIRGYILNSCDGTSVSTTYKYNMP